MPRRKLSEYKAKQIMANSLAIPFESWDNTAQLESNLKYVVKVDQATKKRFKSGLIGIGLDSKQVEKWIHTTKQKGYTSFIVEPYRSYAQAAERYLSLTRDARGIVMSISQKGGIDVEDYGDDIHVEVIKESTDLKSLGKMASLTEAQLSLIVHVFESNYLTLLEINPYAVIDGRLVLLDVAMEVDDAARLLVDTWNEDDFRNPPRSLSGAEKTVMLLNDSSPASFAFQMINSDGSLFVLLSGGGASVTICDEVYNAGRGDVLANYGEYSGNPTTEETYIYTSAIIQSLLASKASSKVLLIAGAVANFTDIAKTFAGITKAIEEYGHDLHNQKIKIVVRRGGPNQKIGLQSMKKVLDDNSIENLVFNHETSLDEAVRSALERVL